MIGPTEYDYDGYGNQTQVTTYAGHGTRQYTGGNWVYSAPGSGSHPSIGRDAS